jgi:ElaB/YqjD/DUF883 family membrane-anchored ribosome-binding protein
MFVDARRARAHTDGEQVRGVREARGVLCRSSTHKERLAMNNRSGNEGVGQQRLDSIKDSVKGIVDQGQEKVHQFRDRVVDAKQQAVSKGNEYLERVTEFIRANPLKSVGIAFGVGYIAMRLFRR